MRKNLRLIAAVLIAFVAVVAFFIGLSHTHMDVLSPAGAIAGKQKTLLIVTIAMMLLIVIPVFGLTLYIPWKYRASNHRADYQPDWDHDRRLETIWWAFPCAIVAVLATLAWTSSHSLDPARQLASTQKPLIIEVVALQWKWLFIYPEQHIASVNYVQFPAGRPVEYRITADAPMNSFWIPRLGGQMYAMSGMTTQLHLIADKPGSYIGSSANISGEGFASMHFVAEATNTTDFANWVSSVQHVSNSLSYAAYSALARPGISSDNIQYASSEPGLYETILNKYSPSGSHGYMTGAEPAVMMEGMTH